MAYLKIKNGDFIIVNEHGLVVTGSASDLLEHPAMTTTDAYEIIETEAPIIIRNKIIFTPPEVS